MSAYHFGGIEAVKILYVCCDGKCRRNKEREVTANIQAKGNVIGINNRFIISESVITHRQKIEINRNYIVLQDELEESVRGRMFNKAETCEHLEQLTYRLEAIIAKRLT